MSNIEKGCVFIAIAFLACGNYNHLNCVYYFGVGAFLGLGISCYYRWDE